MTQRDLQHAWCTREQSRGGHAAAALAGGAKETPLESCSQARGKRTTSPTPQLPPLPPHPPALPTLFLTLHTTTKCPSSSIRRRPWASTVSTTAPRGARATSDLPITGPFKELVKKSLKISNPNVHPVAFKVKTTAPKVTPQQSGGLTVD